MYGRTGPKASTLIPEIVVRGQKGTGADAPLLLNTSSALVTQPWGEKFIPFSQSTTRGELRQFPLGDDSLPFAQGSGGLLQVQTFAPTPTSTGIGVAFTMVRAAMSTAETVHFTGTAGQVYDIGLIHIANVGVVSRRARVWITPGVAGTLATTIIPSTAVAATSILQDNGPHILKSTSQLRAQASLTGMLSINVTGKRTV